MEEKAPFGWGPLFFPSLGGAVEGSYKQEAAAVTEDEEMELLGKTLMCSWYMVLGTGSLVAAQYAIVIIKTQRVVSGQWPESNAHKLVCRPIDMLREQSTGAATRLLQRKYL
jgi:hypothetical protein